MNYSLILFVCSQKLPYRYTTVRIKSLFMWKINLTTDQWWSMFNSTSSTLLYYSIRIYWVAWLHSPGDKYDRNMNLTTNSYLISTIRIQRTSIPFLIDFTIWFFYCVSVCVWERERERERVLAGEWEVGTGDWVYGEYIYIYIYIYMCVCNF
jgi:hypothetical protein